MESKWFLTVNEAAKLIGVGRTLMLDLVKAEIVPAIRFRRKIVIKREQLLKWFNEQTEIVLV